MTAFFFYVMATNVFYAELPHSLLELCESMSRHRALQRVIAHPEIAQPPPVLGSQMICRAC